ncbi:hypothetical protein [Archangium sp.]|uniref:hypothetical protein n=1 Tax=Archangium sp. TaxID=1872627 RepID=UPI00286AA781|nr:hypothetical protein [Archangium sp.]
MLLSAMEDLVGLLDRQFRFLFEQNDEDFARELRRTLGALGSEPRLALLLRETRDRVHQLLRQFERHDRETVERLKKLRNRLEHQVPELDSPSDHQTSGASKEDESTHYRLADFDAAVVPRTGPQALTRGDGSTSGQLTLILEELFWRAIYGEDFHRKQELRPEVRPLQQKFLNVREAHIRTWRTFYDMVLTEPGSAFLYLEACLEAILSGQPLKRSPEEWRVFGLLGFKMPVLEPEVFYDDHHSETHLPQQEKQNRRQAVVRDMRRAAQRLYHGLQLLLGTRRSVQVVFERFKTRCEWYDRDRLRALATEKPKAVRAARSRPRQIEQRLKNELALYLFDQGLNPLLEVPVGANRSDFFEPSRFYLEAKQYSDASPKHKLLKGVSQTYELMASLRGSQHDPYEAYYVVFRLGGPLVQMDDEVSFAGLTLRTIVIDLAPAISSGSRSVGHLRITAEEMQEQLRKTAQRVSKNSSDATPERQD